MTRAEIDLGAIRHNARTLQRLAGAAGLVGVVKADAYGHGAVQVARALVDEGVPWLAVATIGEAEALREAGLDAPVLVFAAPLPCQLPAYARGGFRATVPSAEGAAAVIEAASQRGPLTVHVKVDTGMHRLGVAPEAAPALVRRLQAAPGVRVEGLWTHFATADEPDVRFVAEQAARFQAVIEALGSECPPLVHATNGPALVRRIGPALSASSLVRAGGVLYGLASSPSLAADVEAAGLQPAMRLVSRVVHLQTVPAGESVSYGRTWTAPRPTRVATIATGYADGLPRAYRGPVGIGARRAPVVGRVCMDMLLVDLGPPGGDEGVRIGDAATLFGPGGASAVEAAEAAGTLSYELSSGLTRRVPRVGLHARRDAA